MLASRARIVLEKRNVATCAGSMSTLSTITGVLQFWPSEVAAEENAPCGNTCCDEPRHTTEEVTKSVPAPDGVDGQVGSLVHESPPLRSYRLGTSPSRNTWER